MLDMQDQVLTFQVRENAPLGYKRMLLSKIMNFKKLPKGMAENQNIIH